MDGEMERWLSEATVPLSIRDLVPKGYTIHTVKQGSDVNFTSIFRSAVRGPIREVILQDPYLSSGHQLKCLGELLGGIPWRPDDGVIPFRLTTHLSEPGPGETNLVPLDRHRGELQRLFIPYPVLSPDIHLIRRKPRPLHMRYLVLTLGDGRRLLYLLERGLDMTDPKSGKATGLLHPRIPEITR